MTRDAKLYILLDKDWKPLTNFIDNHSNQTLKNDITIYQLYSTDSKNLEYAILSLTDTIDKIIEDYGAIIAKEPNLLRNSLHKQSRKPLYGDNENLVLLNKIP